MQNDNNGFFNSVWGFLKAPKLGEKMGWPGLDKAVDSNRGSIARAAGNAFGNYVKPGSGSVVGEALVAVVGDNIPRDRLPSSGV